MGIKWEPVEARTPEAGEHVLVYNGKHVWNTVWREALADKALPAPVTHVAALAEASPPYPMRTLRASQAVDHIPAKALWQLGYSPRRKK